MTTLAAELANEATPTHIRNAAGLAIKNALSARDSQRSAEYAERWFKLTQEERNDVKQKVFAILASQDSRAGQASAQVLASIAAVELPVGQSQDMIGQLLSQMGDVSNVNLRRATLQAIGFICETSVSLPWARARIAELTYLSCLTAIRVALVTVQ
jgi:importin subunit beta-1